MANFSALKTAIQNAIKQNGNEEITGDVLQQILLSVVNTMGDGAINTIEQNLSNETLARQNGDNTLQSNINSEAQVRGNADMQLQNAINAINTYLAKGYVFAGVATPTGTPVSGRVFYVATTAGRYTSFGNLQVQNGISILLVENGSWVSHQLLVVDLSLVQGSTNPVSGGAVYQAIQNEETERKASDEQLQNNINNENSRAVGAENGLHQEIVAERDARIEGLENERDARRQEIQGMRDDVLGFMHEYRPIVIEGNVVNAPDEEDITQQPNNLLKFKDKDYNPTIFSGLGRKYLRKNIIINEDYTSFDGFEMNPEADDMLEGQPDSIFWDRLRERFIAEKDGVYYLDWQGSGDYVPVNADKIYVNENIPYFWNGEDLAVDDDVVARYGNILTQEMMSDANTIYVIQYDFDLGGEEVTIPENCVLEFDGGSLSNGTLVSNNTKLSGSYINSADSLFGVFYTLDGRVLDWNKEIVRNWDAKVEYANFIRDIDLGIDFYSPQGLCMNNDYIFISFIHPETHDGVTANYAAIVVYDRNYNYIGYTRLDKPSHANDLTIYNGNIYIATGDIDNESLHVVSISDVLTNARNNKNTSFDTSTITNVSVINLDRKLTGVDYDAITSTFCVGSEGVFFIYNTSFELIKTVLNTPYTNYTTPFFNRDSIIQGLAYKNGIIYAVNWDYKSGDGVSNSIIIFTIDVAANRIVDVQPVKHQKVNMESEGMCKDPVSGKIYILGRGDNGYANADFNISFLTSANEFVGGNDRMIAPKDAFLSNSAVFPVYIDNSPTNTGKSYGTRNNPFKTLGEAILMAGNTGGRLEFRLVDSGVDYYSYNLRFSETDIRIGGISNTDKPVIDGCFAFRHCFAIFQYLELKQEKSHSSSTLVSAAQNTIIHAFTSDFNIGSNIGFSLNTYCKLYIYEGAFIGESNGVAINFVGDGSHVLLYSVEANGCYLINNPTNNYPNNRVLVTNINNVTLSNNALLVKNAPRNWEFIQVFINEQAAYNKLYNLLAPYTLISNASAVFLHIVLTAAINGDPEATSNVTRMAAGLYFFDILGEGADRHIVFRNINGISANGGNIGTTEPTSPQQGGFFYNTSNERLEIWAGTRWLNALGRNIVKYFGTTSERPTQGAGTGLVNNGRDRGVKYFDTTLGKPIYIKEITSNSVLWVESDGATAGVKRSGTTSNRPVGSDIYIGFMYFDTSLSPARPIYASAISGDTVTWVDATGATV